MVKLILKRKPRHECVQDKYRQTRDFKFKLLNYRKLFEYMNGEELTSEINDTTSR